MQKEMINKANEIIKTIEQNKKTVKCLEKYVDDGIKLTLEEKVESKCLPVTYPEYIDIHFESWEVRLMIHNKKQRIQALEKELEQL